MSKVYFIDSVSEKLPKRRKIFIILSLILIGNMNICTLTSASSDYTQSVDSYIQEIMEKYKIPTLSVAVIENNGTIWFQGYPDENRTEYMYMIASITKTFIATAILQLSEQELIDLDADVNSYLPFELCNPNCPNETITPRMLLSHTSSLRPDSTLYWTIVIASSNGLGAEMMDNWNFNNQTIPGVDSINVTEFIFPFWLDDYLQPGGDFYSSSVWNATGKPGEFLAYANVGYDILAYLVELISNQTINEYLNENIFDPLEMTNTGMDYRDFDEKFIAKPMRITNVTYSNYNLIGGAVGLRSTIEDLSHYLIMHRNKGLYKDQTILEPDTIQMMHQTTPESNYGLGWANDPSLNISGHTGFLYGFTSVMGSGTNYEDEFNNRGLIILSNEGIVSPESNYLEQITSILFNYDFHENTSIKGYILVPYILGLSYIIFYFSKHRKIHRISI
jgi:CubicO group peptidase (beta-lactamase class C family)